jgi:hypothetical protein
MFLVMTRLVAFSQENYEKLEVTLFVMLLAVSAIFNQTTLLQK